MIIFSDSCNPKDDSLCLQQSEAWGETYTCEASIEYCNIYEKDMRRCCPESCGTGVFTEEDCKKFNGMGTCIYPNGAQCDEKGNLHQQL